MATSLRYVNFFLRLVRLGFHLACYGGAACLAV